MRPHFLPRDLPTADDPLTRTLPALLFSKIVPSFSNENISALGPLFLTAAFYQGFSLLSAVIVRFVLLSGAFLASVLTPRTQNLYSDSEEVPLRLHGLLHLLQVRPPNRPSPSHR